MLTNLKHHLLCLQHSAADTDAAFQAYLLIK